jgi:hypothetical protein
VISLSARRRVVVAAEAEEAAEAVAEAVAEAGEAGAAREG